MLEPEPAPVTVSGLWSWSGLLGNMEAIYNIASTYYVGILTIGLLIYVVLNELNKRRARKLVQNQIDALNENLARELQLIRELLQHHTLTKRVYMKHQTCVTVIQKENKTENKVLTRASSQIPENLSNVSGSRVAIAFREADASRKRHQNTRGSRYRRWY